MCLFVSLNSVLSLTLLPNKDHLACGSSMEPVSAFCPPLPIICRLLFAWIHFASAFDDNHPYLKLRMFFPPFVLSHLLACSKPFQLSFYCIHFLRHIVCVI